MSSDSEGDRRSESKHYHHDRRRGDTWKSEQIIVKEIRRVLQQYQGNHQQIGSFRSATKLNLKIIQKKPIYVADDKACIQAVFKTEPKIQLNPFNEFNTQYYAFHSKPQVVFNCHDELVENEEEIPRYPSASHPAFHYKNYQQFKQRRKTTQVLQSCEKIVVKSWGLAIVNISRRGYYAPLLIIHECQTVNENILLEKPVQNILFYEEISLILDQLRLQDIRKIRFEVGRNPFNFAYYARNHTAVTSHKLSRFVNLDTKNSLLISDQKLPLSLIPLGQLQESEIFKRPVHPKYLCKRKKMNLSNFVFEMGANEERIDSPISSSSSFIQDERELSEKGEGEVNQNGGEMVDENEEREEEEESDSEEDYLKKAYKKMMQNQNFL